MRSPTWIRRLQSRWQLSSSTQVILVLLTFACTGFTVMLLKPVITGWLFRDGGSLLFSILYWILILPVYNALLLGFGFVFGQFTFFWNFEKRFFRRLAGKK